MLTRWALHPLALIHMVRKLFRLMTEMFQTFHGILPAQKQLIFLVLLTSDPGPLNILSLGIRRKQFAPDRRGPLLHQVTITVNIEMLEDIDVKNKASLTDLHVSLRLPIAILVLWTVFRLKDVVLVEGSRLLELFYHLPPSLPDSFDQIGPYLSDIGLRQQG